MGLDIVAHETLIDITNEPNVRDEYGDPDYEKEYFGLTINPHFPKHQKGFTKGQVFKNPGKTMRFRAGSYSGYNEWRDILATWKPKAFKLLVNFSDCEGFINSEICAKLAKAFAKHAPNAHKAFRNEWDLQLYSRFQDAFELASHGGCVEFR